MAAADNLDTLAKVKAALEHKLITTEIAEALRRKILQLAAVIVAPVTTVQQEDPTGRAAKEVRLALQVHIGTADRPAMGQKFYNAVFVTPVDELVRTEIATLLSGTPLRNSLADMFRVTGAGEVPTALMPLISWPKNRHGNGSLHAWPPMLHGRCPAATEESTETRLAAPSSHS